MSTWSCNLLRWKEAVMEIREMSVTNDRRKANSARRVFGLPDTSVGPDFGIWCDESTDVKSRWSLSESFSIGDRINPLRKFYEIPAFETPKVANILDTARWSVYRPWRLVWTNLIFQTLNSTSSAMHRIAMIAYVGSTSTMREPYRVFPEFTKSCFRNQKPRGTLESDSECFSRVLTKYLSPAIAVLSSVVRSKRHFKTKRSLLMKLSKT